MAERDAERVRDARRARAVAEFGLIVLTLMAMALASCGGSESLTTPPPSEPPQPPPEPTERIESAAEPITVVSEPASTAVEGHDAPGNLVVPDPLAPGAPGALIATDDYLMLGTYGHRLLHHSQSAAGEDVAVSGFVVYPTGTPPQGGWPLIAWAHGTTGIGDACAPSDDSSLFGLEARGLVAGFIARGYAVVATDYEGLGTPGRHPYLVGASQAHSVLDSVRAVQNMDLPVSEDWIVFGYSQGGHAAMFTAQLQPSYAPELELIGAVVGAPGSDVRSLARHLANGDYQSYLPMVAVGQAAAYPDIDLAEVLTPATLNRLEVVDTGCVAQVFDTFGQMQWHDIAVRPDVFEVGVFADRLAQQNYNQRPTRQPLLIVHGGADEQIPAEMSAELLQRLCAFEGQAPAIRNEYHGLGHGALLFDSNAMDDVFEWAEARFAGEVAPDHCP